jgi:hypothetical protein
MPADSLNPDLNDTTCCVGGCFDVADHMGQAAVRIHHLVGVPEHLQDIVIELPVCAEHAHVLRMGVERFELTTW